jgi:DNA recombination protein RmuC
VRDHIGKLAGKQYWRQFEPSPDFVVMFLPDESYLRVAHEHDPALAEDAWRANVILASPSTLVALLRTVAATWQQETVAESAREVHALGRELYERIGKVGGHLAKLGKSLNSSIGAYNDAVGSIETRVLVTARKLEEHGIGGEIESPSPVDRTARPLMAPELQERTPLAILPGDADAA